MKIGQDLRLSLFRLEKIVGEWTRIPDREISGYEEEYAIKGLRVNIRNAEPYREFQNMDDNDRCFLCFLTVNTDQKTLTPYSDRSGF